MECFGHLIMRDRAEAQDWGPVRAYTKARITSLKRGEGKMKRLLRSSIGGAWLAGALLVCGAASAQQNPPSLHAGYDLAREVNLVGTISSVVEDSKTGPLGTHVLVQTAAGLVDVHVGSAKFLQLNNLTVASGDSVRLIGESFANGSDTIFLARIIQRGTKAVAVRSPKGLPLWPAGARTLGAATKNRGGAQ